MVQSYLTWKALEQRNDSAISLLTKGHFLIQIDCASCQAESFNFESFAELPLDLANLERNRASRRRLKTKFENKQAGIEGRNFYEALSDRFTFSQNFEGLLSTSQRHNRSSDSIREERQEARLPFQPLSEEDGDEQSGGPNSLSSGAINSLNSSSSSQEKGHERKIQSQIAYEQMKSPHTPPKFKSERRGHENKPEEAYPDIFLNELIQEFFSEEYICEYRCQFCKKKTIIRKQYKILKEPEILKITLKRFVHFPKMKKINRPVFLGQENFDLKPFLYNYENVCQSVADFDLFESNVERNNPNASYSNPKSFNRSISTRKVDYEISSYIEHFGTMDQGHYVAFIKDSNIGSWKENRPEDSWILMDDHKVYHIKDHARKMLMYNKTVYSIFLKRKNYAF